MNNTIIYLTFSSLISLKAIGAECPATNFSNFAYDFMEHLAIQQSYTKLPLSFEQGSGDPDIPSTKSMISASEIKFPIIENSQKRKQMGYHYSIETPFTIRFFTPGTGILILYKFEKFGNCWQLVAKEDESM